MGRVREAGGAVSSEDWPFADVLELPNGVLGCVPGWVVRTVNYIDDVVFTEAAVLTLDTNHEAGYNLIQHGLAYKVFPSPVDYVAVGEWLTELRRW